MGCSDLTPGEGRYGFPSLTRPEMTEQTPGLLLCVTTLLPLADVTLLLLADVMTLLPLADVTTLLLLSDGSTLLLLADVTTLLLSVDVTILAFSAEETTLLLLADVTTLLLSDASFTVGLLRAKFVIFLDEPPLLTLLQLVTQLFGVGQLTFCELTESILGSVSELITLTVDLTTLTDLLFNFTVSL